MIRRICSCHSSNLYASLVECPRCHHRSFDPYADACERRACGYVKNGSDSVPARRPKGPPQRDKYGYYTTPLGRFMSVTTILGKGLPQEELIHWAAWEAARCAVDSIPQLVKARGDEARSELALWIQKASERKRDKAADLGSTIHGFLEAQILGQPTPDYTDEQRPFIDGFARFLDDWQPQYEATELTVANPEHHYAGTLDCILRVPMLGDGLAMGDYKTGKSIWSKVGLQLSAYRRATVGWTKPEGTQVTPPETSWAFVLHVRPKDMPGGHARGYALRKVDTSDEVFAAFLAAQVTAEYHVKDGPASRVVGPVEKPPSVQEEIPA